MIYPHTGPLRGLQTCAHSNQALVYPRCVSHALYSIVSRSSVLYLQLLLLSPVARSSADTVSLKESSDLQHISISVANTVVSLNPKLTRHLQHFCPAFFFFFPVQRFLPSPCALLAAAATHKAAKESCSLVRLRGWLDTEMPYARGSSPSGRFPLRMALLATLRKDTMLCHATL